jgi:hypothetical protein
MITTAMISPLGLLTTRREESDVALDGTEEGAMYGTIVVEGLLVGAQLTRLEGIVPATN